MTDSHTIDSQLLLRNSVPAPANLRGFTQIPQVAQHATIANLRSLTGLVGLILYMRADEFKDTLQNVFVKALREVAPSAGRHMRDLAS